MGTTYRLTADLGRGGLWTVDSRSQSGNTPHHADRLDAWSTGEYHNLPLDRADASLIAVERLVFSASS